MSASFFFVLTMIEIFIDKDSSGTIVALTCRGHAGFDDGEGLDLVCAGVSAVTGALGFGLTEKVRPPLSVSVADGYFSVDLRRQQHPPSREASFLLDTLGSSLILLAQSYPGFIELQNGQAG